MPPILVRRARKWKRPLDLMFNIQSVASFFAEPVVRVSGPVGR